MTDFAWAAPVATGVAGIVTASVAWRVATSQAQQLRLAIEMKGKIPAELEKEWDHFLYSSAAAVIRRSKQTVVPIFAAVASWTLLVTAVVLKGNFWLLGGGIAAALVGIFFSRRKSAQLKKDEIERTARLEKARAELDAKLVKERAAGLQASKDVMNLADTTYKETMESLFRAGAPNRVALAYMLGMFEDTFIPVPGRPHAVDPRASGATLTWPWRLRAWWRKVRRSSLNLDQRLFPEVDPAFADFLTNPTPVPPGPEAIPKP